jgi:hypothetical protein
MTLVEHYLTDHSQDSDSIGRTRAVLDRIQFGNCVAMVRSSDSSRSSHSFHPGSSHLDYKKSNSTDSDLPVLSVLYLHLGDVMALAKGALELEQQVQETVNFVGRHAPSGSAAAAGVVGLNMMVLSVVVELARPPDGGI